MMANTMLTFISQISFAPCYCDLWKGTMCHLPHIRGKQSFCITSFCLSFVFPLYVFFPSLSLLCLCSETTRWLFCVIVFFVIVNPLLDLIHTWMYHYCKGISKHLWKMKIFSKRKIYEFIVVMGKHTRKFYKRKCC